MSEMIERVAKAIAISGNGGMWDDWYSDDQKEFHRRRARAAIEAMREPTREMTDAVWVMAGEADQAEIWSGMIDAALSGVENKP